MTLININEFNEIRDRSKCGSNDMYEEMMSTRGDEGMKKTYELMQMLLICYRPLSLPICHRPLSLPFSSVTRHSRASGNLSTY